MYATDWPCRTGSPAPAVARQRSEGRLALVAALRGATTRVAHLAESGSARLRLPRIPGPGLEAVTINTGGGITGGDVFATTITAEAGADLAVTSAAAEKIYRSDGSTASIDVALGVERDARLAWIPQETIVFDKARMRRRLTADVAPGGTLLVCEAMVFGRAAHEEVVETGAIEDRWRIRLGGRLVYADTLRLDGAVASLLRKPGVAAAARALATVLYVAEDCERQLDSVRDVLAGSGMEAGASAWGGLLAVRILAQDSERLRRLASEVISLLRGRAMPRVWAT